MIGVLVQRHREQHVVVLLISYLGFLYFFYYYIVFLKVILYEKKVILKVFFFPLISFFSDYNHQIKMYVEEIEIYQNYVSYLKKAHVRCLKILT